MAEIVDFEDRGLVNRELRSERRVCENESRQIPKIRLASRSSWPELIDGTFRKHATIQLSPAPSLVMTMLKKEAFTRCGFRAITTMYFWATRSTRLRIAFFRLRSKSAQLAFSDPTMLKPAFWLIDCFRQKLDGETIKAGIRKQ